MRTILSNLILLSLSSVLVFVSGCGSADSFARVDYDFTSLNTVAVIDVIGTVGSEGARNQIADFVSIELLKKGYAPIERAQVQSLLKEQQFQASDATSDIDVVKAGRVLNVPTVIIINVPEFKEDMSMTIKMLDVETASVLWLASGSGTTGKTLATILGAAGGAAAGVMAGGDDSSDKTVGGVIGGVAGGAAANLLSPQQAQTAQKIIAKMCKQLPSRLPQAEKKSLLDKIFSK